MQPVTRPSAFLTYEPLSKSKPLAASDAAAAETAGRGPGRAAAVLRRWPAARPRILRGTAFAPPLPGPPLARARVESGPAATRWQDGTTRRSAPPLRPM